MAEVSTEEAEQVIKDRLDDSWFSISTGALQRHGGITNKSKHNIIVQGTITIFEQKSSIEIDSSVSQTQSPRSAFENAIRENPFRDRCEYSYPDPETVEEKPCHTCSNTGQVVCDSCNGNKRVDCTNCDINGVIIEQIPCENCNGKEDSGSCGVCDGRGTVLQEEECPRCNGDERHECRTCRGTGEIDCETCDATGYVKAYESVTFRVRRDISVSNLPDWWNSSAAAFAEAVNWDRDQLFFDYSDQSIDVNNSGEEIVFFEITYSESTYNVAVRNCSSEYEHIWDPETGYPRTSLRRKLSDLKTRLQSFR